MSNFKNIWYSSELFLGAIFIGTMVSISSSNWMMVWVGMELNMMAFLGWMCSGGKTSLRLISSWGFRDKIGQFPPNVEPFAKYFLAQSVGSSLYLLCPLVWGVSLLGEYSGIFLLFGMLMKGGAAPFHQWFPSVCSSVSWGVNTLLMFWQKIAPLYIVVGGVFSYSKILLVVALMNLFFGVFGAMGQTQLRALFAYSSISHMGWMFAMMYFSKVGFFYYFLLYGLMIMPTLGLFKGLGVYSFKDLSKISKLFGGYLLAAIMMILGVSGMPPFMGFFMKVYSIYLMLYFGYFWLALSFCGFAVISLFYYLNVIFMIFLLQVMNFNGEYYSGSDLLKAKLGYGYGGMGGTWFIVLWVMIGLPFVGFMAV